MRITETAIPGAFLIEIEKHIDERGFFARVFDEEFCKTKGLESTIVQASISFSLKTHTLRGLHYQAAPHEEVRWVRVNRGFIYDVIVDVRPSSPAFKKYFAVELHQDNYTILYVPEGVAHGFLTLTDNTEVLYFMSHAYTAQFSKGVRWNDPAFTISWPYPPQVISERDRTFPDFTKNI